MHTLQNNNLKRKQIMLSDSNIQKLDKIARKKNKSVAEIVRTAIDFYDPNAADNMESKDLMELVSVRLKEAIADTAETRKRLDKTLKNFESREVE